MWSDWVLNWLHVLQYGMPLGPWQRRSLMVNSNLPKEIGYQWLSYNNWMSILQYHHYLSVSDWSKWSAHTYLLCLSDFVLGISISQGLDTLCRNSYNKLTSSDSLGCQNPTDLPCHKYLSFKCSPIAFPCTSQTWKVKCDVFDKKCCCQCQTV